MQAIKSGCHRLQSAMIVESQSSKRGQLYVSVQTASLVQFDDKATGSHWEVDGLAVRAPNPRNTQKNNTSCLKSQRWNIRIFVKCCLLYWQILSFVTEENLCIYFHWFTVWLALRVEYRGHRKLCVFAERGRKTRLEIGRGWEEGNEK